MHPLKVSSQFLGVASFNSLFEMHVEAAKAEVERQKQAFNSLFEMPDVML